MVMQLLMQYISLSSFDDSWWIRDGLWAFLGELQDDLGIEHIQSIQDLFSWLGPTILK